VDDLSGSVPPPEVRYIERLGGSKRARAKLQLYLRLPKGLTNRGEAAYLLGWCGRSAVPTLIRLLGDQDDYVRVQSAQALAHLGPEAEVAVPALMTTLSDPQPGVRSSAAQALGTIGPAAREAAPLLMQILKGPMPYERQAAAFALGRIGDARAVGPLQGLLTEADWSGRWIAARALGDLGPSAKEAIPALEMLLSDREERVRLIAAEALKKIKGEEPPK
jgi:HEAT repeat protein